MLKAVAAFAHKNNTYHDAN